MEDFSAIIDRVLHAVIIPLLPLYICGTFTNMTYSGKTFAILGILWKVFLVVIAMHLIYIAIQFTIAGMLSGKNPIMLIRNQISGYATARYAVFGRNQSCELGVCKERRHVG